MRRYNHRMAERRWRENRNPGGERAERVFYGVVPLPSKCQSLSMENARLLVYGDLYRRNARAQGTPVGLCMVPYARDFAEQSLDLGVGIEEELPAFFDLCVEARDYAHLGTNLRRQRTLSCGRLLGGDDAPVMDYIPEYGADAVRFCFLFQGPPGRDLDFRPEFFDSAFRFVQRVWRRAQEAQSISPLIEEAQSVTELHTVVQNRLGLDKPHTALAAIMQFLSEHQELTQKTMREVAAIMAPFTPFLSAEVLDFLPNYL